MTFLTGLALVLGNIALLAAIAVLIPWAFMSVSLSLAFFAGFKKAALRKELEAKLEHEVESITDPIRRAQERSRLESLRMLKKPFLRLFKNLDK